MKTYDPNIHINEITINEGDFLDTFKYQTSPSNEELCIIKLTFSYNEEFNRPFCAVIKRLLDKAIDDHHLNIVLWMEDSMCHYDRLTKFSDFIRATNDHRIKIVHSLYHVECIRYNGWHKLSICH